MPSVWVLTSIAIIVVSFIMGFVFFYINSPLSNETKKKQLEEVSSFLINFVIFIWIGKILLNISLFIKDPLAILAYPSNSKAFYMAVFFSVLHIGYKGIKNKMDVKSFLLALLPVFLVASFVYEFIQIVWNGNTYSWQYLGLLMVLVVFFLFFHGRMKDETIGLLVLTLWSVGQLILALYLPYTTVFGYMMAPLFLVIVLGTGIVLLLLYRGGINL